MASILAFGGCVGDCTVSEPTEAVQRFRSSVCVAPPRPTAAIELVQVFEGLEVEAPVRLQQAPRRENESSGRWFIVDQHGLVHSFFVDEDGRVTGLVTSDLRDRVNTRDDRLDERGLLGLALHPNFPEDNRVFLGYTADDGGVVSRVSSFELLDGVIDGDSEIVLVQTPQPYNNHNGGHVAFGPDGYLYAGLGDGGRGGDPEGNGQNKQTLLGAILRIDVDDVDDDLPYAIPDDNPFAESGGLPEIYAYGFRNPWRFEFDFETNELWAGDVGQALWEDVHIVEKGGNHGWNVWEGKECYPPSVSDCPSDGFVEPVHVYAHPSEDDSRSITGGFVYRGSAMPELVGQYLFGDYVTGEIWKLARVDGDVEVERLIQSDAQISSFAQDEAGELYVLDYGQGRVLRIEAGEGASNSLPETLADTGCVDPDDMTRIAESAIPYDVAQSFWSDGVDKERYIVLPKGKRVQELRDGDLEVPPGTMLIKNFRHDDKIFETRFYVRHTDGEYSGYSYAWSDDGKRAELVERTRVEKIGDLDWIYPGRGECNRCHTAAAGRSLGFELRQLNIQDPDGGSQLERLRRAGVFDDEPDAPEAFPALDADASVESRARAYLHVNCSPCHQPLGPARGGMDLRFDRPLADTGLCEAAELGDLGTRDGARVAPGAPEESVVVARMSRRDGEAMPPLASKVADEVGVDLISQWIESLDECSH